MTREQISKRIKELEIKQRILKAFRDHSFKNSQTDDAANYQSSILQNKKEINMLLSIVYWHKKAKKLYADSKKKSP